MEFTDLFDQVLNTTNNNTLLDPHVFDQLPQKSDKLSSIILMSLLIWIIRKNIPEEQRVEFIQLACKRMEDKLIGVYNQRKSEPVFDLALPCEEMYRKLVRNNVDDVSVALSKMLVGA